MRVARIRYTFELDIPCYDDRTDDDERFDLFDNHCLGTGRPGQTFEKMLDWHDENSTCWACGFVQQEWLGIRDEPNPAEWLKKPEVQK